MKADMLYLDSRHSAEFIELKLSTKIMTTNT